MSVCLANMPRMLSHVSLLRPLLSPPGLTTRVQDRRRDGGRLTALISALTLSLSLCLTSDSLSVALPFRLSVRTHSLTPQLVSEAEERTETDRSWGGSTESDSVCVCVCKRRVSFSRFPLPFAVSHPHPQTHARPECVYQNCVRMCL